MTYNFCTSGAVIMKAGKNASSIAIASAALLQEFSDEAEAYINTECRYDFIANYSKIGTNYKFALAEAASALIGNKIIHWDMSGYTNRGEAEDMININNNSAMRIIDMLKDKKTQETLGAI